MNEDSIFMYYLPLTIEQFFTLALSGEVSHARLIENFPLHSSDSLVLRLRVERRTCLNPLTLLYGAVVVLVRRTVAVALYLSLRVQLP